MLPVLPVVVLVEVDNNGEVMIVRNDSTLTLFSFAGYKV
jgi:hypothetical protein